MKLAFLRSRYYLKFSLDRDPFPSKSTPKKLFLTHNLTRLMDQIISVIKTQSETQVVESSAGAGKSVLAEYLSYLKEPNWHLSLIHGNANMDKVELAHAIISQHFPGHRFQLTRSDSTLQEFLQLYQRNGKLPVVVIDDAHLLPQDTLKFVLEISSMQYEDAQYRFVLFADLSITGQLNLPSFKKIDSGHRIYKRIPSFSKSQTGKYLEHRLSLVGRCEPMPFNDDDVEAIFRNSVGIPGEIHALAKQHMQDFVFPGRTKKIVLRSAAAMATGFILLVVVYAGMSIYDRDPAAVKAPVSIALTLPASTADTPAVEKKKTPVNRPEARVLVSEKKDRKKAISVISKIIPTRSNKDVLLADMKRQATKQARKVAEARAKQEIRIQLAIYDSLALRVSDVVHN